MNPAERDVVFGKILAAWPRPPMPDGQQALWVDHLTALDYATALKVVEQLIVEKPHRPALSDFHQAYNARRPPADHASRYRCGMCINGWIEVPCPRPECAIPDHVALTRCPNGCMPMTPDERQSHTETQERRWDDERRQRVRTGGGTAPLDFTESGAHDPDEPF